MNKKDLIDCTTAFHEIIANKAEKGAIDLRKAMEVGRSVYQCSKKEGRTSIDRWENGIDHHPISIMLMSFLSEHDFCDYNDHFCWKYGGDGDNGETLMYEMDAFFETVAPVQDKAN